MTIIIRIPIAVFSINKILCLHLFLQNNQQTNINENKCLNSHDKTKNN